MSLGVSAWRRWAALALLLAGIAAAGAWAHEIRPAVVDIDLEPGSFSIRIRVNLEALMAEIGPAHEDTSESANAPRYDALRTMPPSDLERAFGDYQGTFLDSISVLDQGGTPVPLRVEALVVEREDNLVLSRDSVITLVPRNPVTADSITWSWAEAYGANVVRVNDAADIVDGDAYSAYLGGGEASRTIPLVGGMALGTGEVVRNYLVIGFTHILPAGLDHILFVVGLFLLSPAWRPLLIQVTSFTVAHTVTLALGSLGVINLSPVIVEPLIAASIVYVALENVVSSRLQRWRPAVVFAFGLLHGLGFAGVLVEAGIDSGQFITALLAFNVGVELGQIAVIVLCLLLFGFWFRGQPWYRSRVTIPLSLVIALVGAYWFVERTMLA